MHVKSTIGVLVLAMLTCVATQRPSRAATWTVEADGSGDFAIIQDAIDAAAPGDSILIGPGRYDTFRAANSTVDNFPFAVICWVTKPNLTIVGAGRDSTFIGPITPTAEVDGLGAASVYLDGGASGSKVAGMQLDNTQAIVTIRDRAIIEGCRVDKVPLSNAFSVTILGGEGAVVRGTELIGPDGILTGSGTIAFTVEDCVFIDDALQGYGVGIGNGALDCAVRRCEFRGGAGGVQFGLGATGVVEDCIFKGVKVVGIDLSQGIAVVRRCEIGPTRQTLRAGSGRLEVYDSVIGEGSQATLVAWSDVLIRGSHLLNSGVAPTVLAFAGADKLVDVRHNWWGTTDTAQVQAWIQDDNDTVLWSPIADAPIPNEQASMSAVKGRYRR